MEPDSSRRIQIVLASLLMGAAIYVLGNNFFAERRTARVVPSQGEAKPMLLQEAGVFAETPQFTSDEVSTRTLADFHSRRAYPGAPPVVPHKVLDPSGRGCLGCHGEGGWVPDFKAYTPVTPHPHWTNCLSCHIPGTERSRFRENSFVAMAWPSIGQAALPGGPPVVPHSLQNRSNCQACHAGPGAVKEIRTDHPQRQNCRQCHVSPETSAVFVRGTGSVPQ